MEKCPHVGLQPFHNWTISLAPYTKWQPALMTVYSSSMHYVIQEDNVLHITFWEVCLGFYPENKI